MEQDDRRDGEQRNSDRRKKEADLPLGGDERRADDRRQLERRTGRP